MKKSKSGSHRRCDTARHKKKVNRYRGDRRDFREQQVAAKEIERIHTEAKLRQELQPMDGTIEVCPLCNKPITAEDLKGNIHKLRVDHKDVRVHRTCPGEE